MKLGMLKTIMNENKLTKMCIRSKHNSSELTVVEALFDQTSRAAVYLKASSTPPPRTNRYNSIRSYIFDFKDTHTVFVELISKQNTIYQLDTSFEIDKSNGVLYLHIV